MNRESFDMDGSLLTPEPNSRKKNKKKNSNKIMLFIFVVLVILCIIAGYFYIVSVKKTIDNEINTEVVAGDNSESKVEVLEDSIVNDLNAETPSTTISQTNVNPVIKDADTTTIALDISKVKSDKAKKAVQFVDHIVRDEETLNSIAELYGLKVQTLISINDIKNISGVVEGVELSIQTEWSLFM